MKKNTFANKNDLINIRCTSQQKKAIETAAKRDGLGVSGWMLQLALRAVREAPVESEKGRS
jgi:uncharacterized protein (DUF1778 family)